MDSILSAQINIWHNKDEHKKIIEAIEKIPESEWDYETIGLLARAYNNIDDYGAAVKLLESVKEQGENDSLWLFRLGYAYYYLENYEKALELFEKCKAINPNEQDVDYYINESKEELADRFDFPVVRQDKPLSDYTAVIKHENSISMCFYIEREKPFNVGKKMQEINKNAYMNGYNWEAFLNYALAKYAPFILEGMSTDPEAGMYVAYYDLTPENEKRADLFAELIRELIEDENELYRIIREEGENIKWD